MGVQLSGLLSARSVDFKDITGKRIAIDAYNALYQFLSIIRQPTGEPLMDADGRVTSHLSGLLYRSASLLEYGILPAYVFDGKPPAFKRSVVEGRIEARKAAEEKWKAALERGDVEEARLHAQGSSQISKDMLEDAKRLLGVLGIPFVQAPSEGEAQAGYMAMQNTVWAAASQDYDSLLFGAPRLLRNIAVSGRRKLPRKNVYVNISPEVFELKGALGELELNREQLVELCILVGTDYNPGGVEGLGPKKSYKIIKEYGSIERAVSEGVIEGFEFEAIKDFFLKPPISDDYELKWNTPADSEVLGFLCDERDFSPERVMGALEKIRRGIEKGRSQFSLDGWL